MLSAAILLNTNAFPALAQNKIGVASERLGLFFYHCLQIKADIAVSRNLLYHSLDGSWKELREGAHKAPSDLVAFSDGTYYLSRLHSILYELKAFLDIVTPIICILISGKAGPDKFNKGKVDEKNISGAKLINWIHGHKDEELPYRDAIVASLTHASTEWISKCVAWRDTLSHFNNLPGVTHMHVPISKGPKNLRARDILDPRLPEQQAFPEFAFDLTDKMGSFVATLFPLIPGVDGKLLAGWSEAKQVLMGR